MKLLAGFAGILMGVFFINYFMGSNVSQVRGPSADKENLRGIIYENDDETRALFEKTFGDSQCSAQWMSYLKRKKFGIYAKQMKPPLSSKIRITNNDSSVSFFAPTTVVGHWVEIRKFAHTRKNGIPGRIEIRDYAPQKNNPTKIYKKINRWRAATGCKKVSKTKTYKLFKASDKAESFDDRDLRSLVFSNKASKSKGLIYLWSPQMPYSSSSLKSSIKQPKPWGLESLIKVAKDKGLKIEFLLDPTANIENANVKAKEIGKHFPVFLENGVQRAMSLDLYLRMTGIHYPSLIYYSQVRIAVNHLPGMTD
ncbi:MAG: hypothetical protein ACI9QD_001003, partial [Thermoproteota archaeon]